MDVLIRRAKLEDAARIFSLVDEHAQRGQVLPRTLKTIQDNIENWLVASQF